MTLIFIWELIVGLLTQNTFATKSISESRHCKRCVTLPIKNVFTSLCYGLLYATFLILDAVHFACSQQLTSLPSCDLAGHECSAPANLSAGNPWHLTCAKPWGSSGHVSSKEVLGNVSAIFKIIS